MDCDLNVAVSSLLMILLLLLLLPRIQLPSQCHTSTAIYAKPHELKVSGL